MRVSLLLIGLWLLVPLSARAQADAVDQVVPRLLPPPSGLTSHRFQPGSGDLTPFRRAWLRSAAPLVAAAALDVASSYGGRELNPLLAGRRGTFDARSAALKFGLTGALLGVEYLILRKHPERARARARLNWIATGITAGVAVRNFAVR